MVRNNYLLYEIIIKNYIDVLLQERVLIESFKKVFFK